MYRGEQSAREIQRKKEVGTSQSHQGEGAQQGGWGGKIIPVFQQNPKLLKIFHFLTTSIVLKSNNA